MNLKEDIKSITNIKSHAEDIIKHIHESKNPVIVNQNGEAKGVLFDYNSY